MNRRALNTTDIILLLYNLEIFSTYKLHKSLLISMINSYK